VILLGQRLSGSGVDFISAKAIHDRHGMLGVEIVYRSVEDLKRMVFWCADHGIEATHRLATPEEIARHDAVIP
jgi:hypothetical protein